MKEFIRVMKALSDPGRVKIVKMLEKREMCVCELTAALGLAQPTVSKHLRLLEDAGLVASRKEGSWVNYRLDRDGGSPYAAVLLREMGGWLNNDPEIADLVLRVHTFDRERLSAA
ncbi:MAG: hypothetical protein Kow0089_07650 [Desulfobulbaceae bacterium]